MNRTQGKFLIVSMTVFTLLIALTFLVGAIVPVSAQTATPAPTATQVYAAVPVESLPMVKSGNAAYAMLFPMTTVATTATVYGPILDVTQYNGSEIQYVIDQDTRPTTVTVKLQSSNDGVHWSDKTIIADNVADASAFITNTAIVGRLNRLAVTSELTTPVTITVDAVLDPVVR